MYYVMYLDRERDLDDNLECDLRRRDEESLIRRIWRP